CISTSSSDDVKCESRGESCEFEFTRTCRTSHTCDALSDGGPPRLPNFPGRPRRNDRGRPPSWRIGHSLSVLVRLGLEPLGFHPEDVDRSHHWGLWNRNLRNRLVSRLLEYRAGPTGDEAVDRGGRLCCPPERPRGSRVQGPVRPSLVDDVFRADRADRPPLRSLPLHPACRGSCVVARYLVGSLRS